ncbi:hypothetical protein ED733_005337 [Metarhizium rileyi]|uniref:DUF28 domain protein n=1 Tax=Metarhizium rileyi (strain RCEF 4871) TaxID=1649241 RepID=A0A5C6GGX3_METRR|nr:hypothetical protein ED733_005337 [Metarhizium rileyi]
MATTNTSLALFLATYVSRVSAKPKLQLCRRCLVSFSTSQATAAGHNKWSKTKHIKAVTDKKKMAERTTFTKLIAMYSRMHGENVKFNPQLAHAIAAATKASVPKALVEAAVARGQGRSATGAQLEAMTFEVLMPPNIALIADIETDNKNRTLHDLKYVVKKAGGVTGSTSFYFSRRGRITLKNKQGGPTLSDLLEEAIEHEGADDIEELPDGNFLAWTQPAQLMAITEALSSKFELEVIESDIIWAANEDTKATIDSKQSVESLDALFTGLREYPEVKAIFANISQGSTSEEEWEKIERHIDV